MNWKHRTGMGIHVVVIDSGIAEQHKDLEHYSFRGMSINYNFDKQEFIHSLDYSDCIGHGTAVVSIIKRLVPNVDITIIRIFHEKLTIGFDLLCHTLEYVESSIPCDIIHLSLGVPQCSDLTRLKSICDRLCLKGTIIVSAFENGGALSFPARFESVIGVDSKGNSKGDFDYDFVDKSEINILAKGKSQRLAWLSPEYVYMSGTSFAAAYVTGYVTKLKEEGFIRLEEILNELRCNATKVYDTEHIRNLEVMPMIKKAIVFPFNKEIHSIARFQDLLTFEITGFFDIKYTGQVGKRISQLIPDSDQSDVIVRNFEEIDWNEDFDTVILGHTKLMAILAKYDFAMFFIEKCIQYRKNIYSFESLVPYDPLLSIAEIQSYFPRTTLENIPVNRFGRLRLLGKPVLGIFGTSSSQGKHTLQLLLRRYFLNDGYRVGQLGTEPSALLFGMNAVYPMGYYSTVELSGYNAVHALNEMMGVIEDTDPDIIIVGCQSGTIPVYPGSLAQYTTAQLEFVQGTQPDAYILCINLHDELSLITRTIGTLENLTGGKVIAFVIYPMHRTDTPWTGYKVVPTKTDELEDFLIDLQKSLCIPGFILSAHMQDLFELVTDYFSGGVADDDPERVHGERKAVTRS